MADTDPEILEEEVKGRSSRLMLFVGILAGLIVGGAGVYFGMGMMGDDPVDETEIVEEEVVEEEAAVPETLVYLYVERMPAALVNTNGQTIGYVFLDLTLEMVGSAEQSYVSARMPRVKDAFLRAISEYGLTRPGTSGELDYDRVSQYLKDAGNNAVGNEYIRGVYITRALRAPS